MKCPVCGSEGSRRVFPETGICVDSLCGWIKENGDKPYPSGVTVELKPTMDKGSVNNYE